MLYIIKSNNFFSQRFSSAYHDSCIFVAAEFILENITKIFTFRSFLKIKLAQAVETLLMEEKDQFIGRYATQATMVADGLGGIAPGDRQTCYWFSLSRNIPISASQELMQMPSV